MRKSIKMMIVVLSSLFSATQALSLAIDILVERPAYSAVSLYNSGGMFEGIGTSYLGDFGFIVHSESGEPELVTVMVSFYHEMSSTGNPSNWIEQRLSLNSTVATGSAYGEAHPNISSTLSWYGGANNFASAVYTDFMEIYTDSEYFWLMENQLIVGANIGDNSEPDCSIHIESTANLSVTLTPEPSTILLMGSGLAGLAAYRRRKKYLQEI